MPKDSGVVGLAVTLAFGVARAIRSFAYLRYELWRHVQRVVVLQELTIVALAVAA